MPDLCTTAQVKVNLGKDVSETNQDVLIARKIVESSASIEAWTQRQLADRQETRRFKVRGSRTVMLRRDLRQAITVKIHPESTAPVTLTQDAVTNGFTLLPFGGDQLLVGTYDELVLTPDVVLQSDWSGVFGFAQIEILGRWGPATIPDDVVLAATVTAARWVQQVSGQTQHNVDVSPGGTPLIPTAALQLLNGYRRHAA